MKGEITPPDPSLLIFGCSLSHQTPTTYSTRNPDNFLCYINPWLHIKFNWLYETRGGTQFNRWII